MSLVVFFFFSQIAYIDEGPEKKACPALPPGRPRGGCDLGTNRTRLSDAPGPGLEFKHMGLR